MLDNEDLLTEILLRLPPKSRLRFQCVSKRWLSIISSPNFRPRRFSAVNGLFVVPLTTTYPRNALPAAPHFVALQDEKPQHILANRLNELCGGGAILSLSSCNGLLCVGFLDWNGYYYKEQFYVYNPTTNQRRRIPDLPKKGKRRRRYDVIAMDIAFDPSKSDHYKLVCVYRYIRCKKFGLSVFSSESGVWRNSDIRIPNGSFHYPCWGAFLNGGIHWLGSWCAGKEFRMYFFLCFDIDNDRLKAVPDLPPRHRSQPIFVQYFGEGGGHLHYIEDGLPHHSMLLDVFEMENDYSQWSLKYRLDLCYLAKLYPVIHRHHIYTEDEDEPGLGLHLFEGKEGLVMSIPGEVIFWHLYDMSVTELDAAHIWPPPAENSNETKLKHIGDYLTCKHFETHAPV